MTKTNSALKPYSFTFPSLQVVHCGAGSIQALRFEIQRLKCHRVYVITGRTLAESTPYLQQLEFRLGDTLVGVHKGTQAHSPISDTLRIVEDVRRCEADIILSLGGGSVVDTAKMIALCIAEGVRQEDEVFDFRMQLKDGKPVAALSKGEAMPHIALPTTLSGAEFSSYAGATNERTGEKYQFKHCGIAPKVVIQDADLTQSTPAWLWASTGVRAIDHCVEAIYSTEHQPFSDALAIHALSLLSRFLVKSTNNPLDSEARRMCQSASCLSLYSPRKRNGGPQSRHWASAWRKVQSPPWGDFMSDASVRNGFQSRS